MLRVFADAPHLLADALDGRADLAQARRDFLDAVALLLGLFLHLGRRLRHPLHHGVEAICDSRHVARDPLVGGSQMVDRVAHAGERAQQRRVHPDSARAGCQRFDRGLDGADGTQQQAEQPPGGRREDAEPQPRCGQVEEDQLAAGAREVGGGEAQHHASGLRRPGGFSARPDRSHEQHRVASRFRCPGREGDDLGGARARAVGSRGPGSGQLGLRRSHHPARSGDQADLEHALHRGQRAEQRGEPIRVLGGERVARQHGELPRLGPALARELGPDPAPGHHDHQGRADQQARSRDRGGESDAEIDAAPLRLSRLAHLRSPEGGLLAGRPGI